MSLLAPPPRYTEEFCNREYNARAMIPDYAELFAGWQVASGDARKQMHFMADLRYGPARAETLDLFPADKPDAPLLVFLHGGYWRSLDKKDFSWVAPAFVARGVSVAVINYGLAPATPIEEIVRQCLRASVWLWRNAERLGFDRKRMTVTGHSAGGHLAAMMLAARWPQWEGGLPQRLYRSGLAISGLFDLEPIRMASYLNVDLHLTPARVAPLSPLYMTPASDAALLTAVGGAESSEFHRQSREFAQAWAPVFERAVDMPGDNHITVCTKLAQPGNALFDAALDLCMR